MNFEEEDYAGSVNFNHVRFTGETSFKSAKFSGNAEFTSVMFERAVNFNGALFGRKVRFNDSIFAFALFGGVKFSSSVDFSSTKFKSVAWFIRSDFGSDSEIRLGNETKFLGAMFYGNANFDHCKFHNLCQFSQASFNSKAVFQKATFVAVDFNDINFKNVAIFTEALFQNTKGNYLLNECEANFRYAVFHNTATFIGARFYVTTSFFKSEFQDDADFESVLFNEIASFNGASFDAETVFNSCNFLKSSHFMDVKFNGITNFTKVTFHGPVEFMMSIFSDTFAFDKTTFNESASFYKIESKVRAMFRLSTFASDAHFEYSTFNGETTFHSSTFAAVVDFRDAIFNSNVSFARVHFQDRAFFQQTIGAELFSENATLIFTNCILDFRSILIDKPGLVKFSGADLSQASFHDTYLHHVDFTNIKWAKSNTGFLHWLKHTVFRINKNTSYRNHLYEELEASKRDTKDTPMFTWEYIERSYRELKLNYESKHAYREMGDFHYGEKEAQRLNKSTPLWMRGLLWFYKVGSGYGERVLPPFVWLVAIFIGCAWMYSVSPLPNYTDFWDALEYSFKTIAHPLFKPDSSVLLWHGKIVYYIQAILGPLFVALFALAVRQKMKR